MNKAAIYMRVSTQNQEKEETIGNQELELLARIAEDADSILNSDCIYKDDGWSGMILERPGIDQMQADALDKKFDVLYFYDRGRISRKHYYQQIVFDVLDKANIKYISLHDVNGDTDEDKLAGNILGLFAEYERTKIASRMRIGKLRKVREHKKLLGYNPKYGYDYLPRIKKGLDERDGQFVINDLQAKTVVSIYQWSASGMSKHAIRDKLYENRVIPAKAKRNIWSTSVIDRLLRDSTYMGVHYYNKTESVETKNHRNPDLKYRKVVKGSRIQRPKDDWLMVNVPVIIAPELFHKVQQQLLRNKKTSRRNNSKNSYLVGGIIECPCGYARTGDPANGCLYYRCCDRLNNPLGNRKCFLPGVNATVLDSLVWENLKKLLTQPQLVFEQAKRWQEGMSPLQLQSENLKERLVRLNESESRYAKMYGEALMSEQIYRDNMMTINSSRTAIADEMTIVEKELAGKPLVPLEQLVDGVIKLVEDLDFNQKKQIVQKTVTKVIATKEEVTVWGRLPVLALQEVGSDVKYSHSKDETQRENSRKLSEVELDVKYRHRRPPQRRQIHPLQRSDR